MQTRATLALLSSMHMDYLQIEKYRLFCSYGVIFFFLHSRRNVFAPFSHSTFSHPRFSVHIAKVAGTVKAALKTFSHKWETLNEKSKKKKFHKQKQEKKIRGDVTIRAKRMYLIKMVFLLPNFC